MVDHRDHDNMHILQAVNELWSSTRATFQKSRYAITVLQTRLDRVKFASPSGSLKVLTQQCILNNKKYFCKLAQLQPDRNPFDKISNAMKKELVELEAKNQDEDASDLFVESKEDVVLQCEVLQMLLNKKITTFQFPRGLTSDTQDAATALWKALLAEKPPDLHTIVRRTCRQLDGKSTPWNALPFFFGMLQLFPNLQVLRLANFKCTNWHLMRIAEHMPKLRVLEMDLGYKLSRKGFEALAKLSFLEEFLFLDTLQEEQEHLLEECFKLLPRLHAVSGRTEPLRCQHDMEIGFLMANTLLEIEEPLTLQLRRLEITTNEDAPFREDVALPELRVLVTIGSQIRMQLDAFPHLTELCVYGAGQDELMSKLGQVGRRLRTLRFFDDMNCDLNAVLVACPYLSELDVHVRELRCAEPLRPDTLQRLRTLHFTLDESDTIQQGLLLQLLRLSPKLRSVDVATVRLAAEEVEGVAELAKKRTCLRKLERFRLKLCIDWSNTLVSCFADEAFIALAIHCPRLHSVDISCDYDF